MPGISLTNFVDFVVKMGMPKQTVVKNIKYGGDYDPRFDFWKKLREGIVEYHSSNKKDKRWLDRLTYGLTDKRKIKRYPEAIKAYKKYLGRKRAAWFEPPKAHWSHGDLTVRINPELGLEYGGNRYVIKLYFKADKITKSRANVILFLLNDSLASLCRNGENLCLLDIAQSKLFVADEKVPDMKALLIGEATSFVSIYEAL